MEKQQQGLFDAVLLNTEPGQQGRPIQKEQGALDDNSDVPVLRRAAMDVLARREHSCFELRQKLLQKFPDTDPQLIDLVLKQLQAEGLQSDARFVESYVRYRKSRGFGYLHINSELSERRVSGGLIEQHLFVDDEDWLTIAEDLVARKLSPDQHLQFASKEHRRVMRFLESRGFSSGLIRRVLQPRLSKAETQF